MSSTAHTEHMNALQRFVSKRKQADGLGYLSEAPIEDKLFCFWDYSNVEPEYKNSYSPKDRPEVISLAALDYVVSRNRTIDNLSCVITSCDRNFSLWREKGVEVKIMPKIQIGPDTFCEQAVDESIQARMTEAIWQYRSYRKAYNDPDKLAPATLVLISGDGSPGEYNLDGFYMEIAHALRSRMRVKIWSWRKSVSPRFYELRTEYPSLLKIHYFDPFAPYLGSCGAADCNFP
ncbi:hypothetical protein BOTBODRAFT_49534 [Botryobasidium botryosum FD-172 SS1]|uniref:NYN domain-containing protein n=1 Tax=Botryobasidium botryosum (strain FD-172 SS1) TaxID=930990 RepID=A0A067LSB4_BOTB1|nr:hypothetical protein BOTBODRAFT_49534 [Botryobasidium botryosum FD-172 SS1]